MSSHPVEVVQIDEILPHDNADKLEIARVKGWQVIVGKGNYVAGDKAVYVPIDSILDHKLEEYLFPPDVKVKLDKSRVKSIKLRGALSQGMLIDPSDVGLVKLFPKLAKAKVGKDVAEIIGVSKYEPPIPTYQRFQTKKGSVKNHPLFTKYTDIENYKYHTEAFKPDEEISVTEKIHGTSTRYGLYPRNTNYKLGFLTKLLVKIGLKSEYEFVWGSRNQQLQTGGKLFYTDEKGKRKDVYGYTAKRYKLNEVLKPGESLYGEIVGEGIQKGYDYGFNEKNVKAGKADDTLAFYAYDVKLGENNYYENPVDFRAWCDERSIPYVPVVFEGKREDADLETLRNGPSVIAPKAQPVREGTVIKPAIEQHAYFGRKVLKHINDKYLLKAQTDFH